MALLRGASPVAGHVDLSPVAISLTIVSLDTSAPRALASLQAASADKSELGHGNTGGPDSNGVRFAGPVPRFAVVTVLVAGAASIYIGASIFPALAPLTRRSPPQRGIFMRKLRNATACRNNSSKLPGYCDIFGLQIPLTPGI